MLFCGAIVIWLNNSMVAVVRGTGNMHVPSVVILVVSALQILLGGGLAMGVWPLPRLGMPGVALGQVLATSVGALMMFAYLVRGRGRVTLRLKGVALTGEMFWDILRVGALGCLQPLQTVLIVLIFTSLVARFGTEVLAGFSIGMRLELMLIPLAFGVGAAAVPMVGIAIGSGHIARARRVAWTAGAVSMAVLGFIGVVVAVAPNLWAARFASEPGVLEAARQYLRLAGPAFGLFGLGLTLFFAQQGSGRVMRPILASTLRLILVAGAGAGLVATSSPVWALFALSGIAMTVYGIATAGALLFTRWSPPAGAAAVKGARLA
jgi:Na+-driven multidrug efflux pump